MTEKEPARKGTQRSARSTAAADEASKRFTDEERAAMPAPDRAMAERLHAIIKASAPGLSPKLWYGTPAYAKDGDEARIAALVKRAVS